MNKSIIIFMNKIKNASLWREDWAKVAQWALASDDTIKNTLSKIIASYEEKISQTQSQDTKERNEQTR